MREIRFRAWDTVDECLVEIDLTDAYHPWIFEASERYKLMQYTGLKDKNGVEIYEGDIISTNHPAFSVLLREVKYEELTRDQWLYMGFNVPLPSSDFKVVGNIYENTELLK